MASDRTRELAREFFSNLRYESSRGGDRGLLEHHVEQFSTALVALLDTFERETRLDEHKRTCKDCYVSERDGTYRCGRAIELETLAAQPTPEVKK